jgi:hypothetical protein
MVSRRPLLQAHFRVQDKGVAFDQLPDGWTLVYAYPDLPCRYCIFALERK